MKKKMLFLCVFLVFTAQFAFSQAQNVWLDELSYAGCNVSRTIHVGIGGPVGFDFAGSTLYAFDGPDYLGKISLSGVISPENGSVFGAEGESISIEYDYSGYKSLSIALVKNGQIVFFTGTGTVTAIVADPLVPTVLVGLTPILCGFGQTLSYFNAGLSIQLKKQADGAESSAPIPITVSPGHVVTGKYTLDSYVVNQSMGLINQSLSTAFSTVLPVTFFGISGVNRRDFNEITWKTATETNNERFIVEKLNVDGKYDSIGAVLGRGTTNQIQTYVFEDNHPGEVSYYRIRSFDFGSQVSTNSITISVVCESCLKTRYWVSGGVLETNNTEIPITVIDISGRVVFYGNFSYTIHLNPGMYLVNGHKLYSF